MKLSRNNVVTIIAFIIFAGIALTGFDVLTSGSSVYQYSVGSGLMCIGLIGAIIFGVKVLSWWNARNKPTYDDVLAQAKRDAGIIENHNDKK